MAINSAHLTDPACAELRLWLPELADGQPLPPEAAHLAAHLPTCPACQAELAELRQLFNDLDALPPELPPLAMRDDFQAMLAEEKAKQAAASPAGLTAARGGQPLASPQVEQVVVNQKNTPSQQWLRVAASVALVAVGAVLGLLLRGGQPASPLAQLTQTEQPAQPSLSVKLAAARQQPATASQRLQLVSQAPAAIVEPNDPAVLTLIHTLDTDPNPNVRLAACEALFRLRSDPRVGPALVEALPLQTDPNVQITLIETLVTLREKRAVPGLEELAKKPDALPAVRLQAESGLGQLI
ncbi:HEAT repeat domain-containing protein [Hymenobacter cheonanensis]|uniref:HEAT repeat domain-containing protein n=1 Tax=Hymenobacter sp. CA2-7 TaxID=3063993 RepID=UPI00271343A4|nr:HEAT repeat domain-containing protein [Hymenobacter sp. CA2-7]MDO7886475.1 HEAT repeat domain-containing protein [Hymenobacter sp. CA2-7]